MKNLLAFAVLGLAAGSCLAHSGIPDPDWCIDGNVVAVGTFQIFPSTITRADVCPIEGGGTRDCGQFDDDYDIGLRLAQSGCGGHATYTRGSGDFGTVVFLADGPSNFVAPTHHALYFLEQGLYGTCVRCDMPPPVLPPLR